MSRGALASWIVVAAVGVAALLVLGRDDAMVEITGGTFVMGSKHGSADEQPPVLVELSAFEIDRTEVTNAEYARFVLATDRPSPAWWARSECPDGLEHYPVVGISWADAAAFCEWENKRLPTEAEWEYACAGPDSRIYPWGDVWNPAALNAQALAIGVPGGWDLLGSGGRVDLRPVGSYPSGAGPFGVLDMAGNASEWVADWYTWTGYESVDRTDPIGIGPPWNHSVRGSSWIDPHGPSDWPSDRIADASRCSARNSSHAADYRLGFRCAR